MIILSMGLLILDLMFTLAGDLPPPRRDADYPPAYALEFMQQPHRECVAETGVSEAAIKRFSDVEIFDDDEKLKCYMGCLFVKAGVSDGNGDLHLGKVLELIPKEFEDIALKMGSRCLKPKGKTPCERAFWFNKCWKLADPVLFPNCL